VANTRQRGEKSCWVVGKDHPKFYGAFSKSPTLTNWKRREKRGGGEEAPNCLVNLKEKKPCRPSERKNWGDASRITGGPEEGGKKRGFQMEKNQRPRRIIKKNDPERGDRNSKEGPNWTRRRGR